MVALFLMKFNQFKPAQLFFLFQFILNISKSKNEFQSRQVLNKYSLTNYNNFIDSGANTKTGFAGSKGFEDNGTMHAS